MTSRLISVIITFAFVSKDSWRRKRKSNRGEKANIYILLIISLLSNDERDFSILMRFVIYYKEVKFIMPSEKVLLAKQEKVEKLTELLNNAVSGVLVDYKGVSVEEDTKLRKELREAGVTYFVEKNTMLRFAMNNAGLEGLTGVLEGTTAIAISNDDQTAPARILGKFSEACKGNKFNLKAGFIEKEIYDETGVKALSKIPSRDILLAQLVGSLQGPIQKLAATLQAVVDKENGAA